MMMTQVEQDEIIKRLEKKVASVQRQLYLSAVIIGGIIGYLLLR